MPGAGRPGRRAGATRHTPGSTSAWRTGATTPCRRGTSGSRTTRRDPDAGGGRVHPAAEPTRSASPTPCTTPAGWRTCCATARPASATATECVTLSEEQGFAFWKALGIVSRGTGHMVAGRPGRRSRTWPRGWPCTTRPVRGSRSPSTTGSSPRSTCGPGGRPRRARELATALAACEESNNRVYEAELHRLAGEVALADSPAGPGRGGSGVPPVPGRGAQPGGAARGSSAGRRASPGCGTAAAADRRGPRPARRRSTAGSPRALPPRTCATPGDCSPNSTPRCRRDLPGAPAPCFGRRRARTPACARDQGPLSVRRQSITVSGGGRGELIRCTAYRPCGYGRAPRRREAIRN